MTTVVPYFGNTLMSTTPHAGHAALVVDKDQSLRFLLAEVLTDSGFSTSCHSLGHSAVTALATQRFDLIITDVDLPDINGLVLCAMAREHYGDGPVILMIMGDKPQDRGITSLELGADDFLPKPFRVDELLARIEAKVRRLPSA